jgi:hypothetical protein
MTIRLVTCHFPATTPSVARLEKFADWVRANPSQMGEDHLRIFWAGMDHLEEARRIEHGSATRAANFAKSLDTLASSLLDFGEEAAFRAPRDILPMN